MPVDTHEPIPWRVQTALYATGFFSMSAFQIVNVLLPLWVITLKPSALLVGLILGARHLFPMLLAIHGGALMDKLGTRRVMLVSGMFGIVVALLFPAMPWVWAVVLLQVIGGLADTFGWMGSQTLVGQLMKGDASAAGTLTFASRLGILVAPPLAGAAWDVFGPWCAFAMLSAWSAGLLLSVWSLPELPQLRRPAGQPVRGSDILPSRADYVAAFKLLAMPAVLLAILATMLRHGGFGIQGSFYVVYLESMDFTGSAIGLLISVAGLAGCGGALLAGPLSRRVEPVSLMLCAVGVSILMLSATPVLGSYVVLAVAAGLFGCGIGISQPLEMSLMGKAAGLESQGKAIGLRMTATRMASFVLPILMGALVETVGLVDSFLTIGLGVVVLLFLARLYARATLGPFGLMIPALQRSGNDTEEPTAADR